MTQKSIDLCGHDNLNSQQWLKSKYDMYIPQVEGKLENELIIDARKGDVKERKKILIFQTKNTLHKV